MLELLWLKLFSFPARAHAAISRARAAAAERRNYAYTSIDSKLSALSLFFSAFGVFCSKSVISPQTGSCLTELEF